MNAVFAMLALRLLMCTFATCKSFWMNIGFDAKRAYHNPTGLGQYSRFLIRSLAVEFPEHKYFLFNPKPSKLVSFAANTNVKEVLPQQWLHRKLSQAWRSNWVKKDLLQNNIQLYHGLSHELPHDIQSTGIKSVVTMHDLIHERFPEQYQKVDRLIYTKKFRHACAEADSVIAISQQTRQDLIDIYGVSPSKIEVCYQGCNPAFSMPVDENTKHQIKKKYGLPDQFWLSVGSIIERKNLLSICKALKILEPEINIPLVIIGTGGAYKQQVQQFIAQNNLNERVIFLSDTEAAKSSANFQSGDDFPAIYQQALALIYPSFFEGFGIPVLEALFSRIPVVTSNVSSLPEAGGHGAFYVNPQEPEAIAFQLKKILTEPGEVNTHIDKGWGHADQFTGAKTAAAVMQVYNKCFDA